jgi:polyhydroxyalkanoate synthesis repressor PhaR
MAILIKRYANRKLYNTETSRYITLKGIAKLLAEGEEVRVVDKETGDDITQIALSQILVDNQRAKEDPSDTLLTQILSRGGDALYGAIKKSVDDATDGIGEFQERFRSLVGQTESRTSGGKAFGWEARGERDRRSPFAGGPGSSRSPNAPDEQARPFGFRSRSDSDLRNDPASQDTTDRADEDKAGQSGGRGSWPRIAGFPDVREVIRSAVAHELDAYELPRTGDIRVLNENLTRVAEAIERLERALRERDETTD